MKQVTNSHLLGKEIFYALKTTKNRLIIGKDYLKSIVFEDNGVISYRLRHSQPKVDKIFEKIEELFVYAAKQMDSHQSGFRAEKYTQKKKFKDLAIGEEFECYGDQHLNYSYPAICRCKKVDDTTGEEIDGIRFGMNDNDEVFVKE